MQDGEEGLRVSFERIGDEINALPYHLRCFRCSSRRVVGLGHVTFFILFSYFHRCIPSMFTFSTSAKVKVRVCRVLYGTLALHAQPPFTKQLTPPSVYIPSRDSKPYIDDARIATTSAASPPIPASKRMSSPAMDATKVLIVKKPA